LSSCGRHALTIIAFVGSVFSPYYAWSGRRDPENHVAINVCCYGGTANAWAMTERGQRMLERGAHHFRVGPSRIAWRDGALVIEIDEVSLPRPPGQWLPGRLRGTVRLTPRHVFSQVHDLDPLGRHKWRPVAPIADIEVDIAGAPFPAWRGDGYLDSNWGSEPLEAGFADWDWSRGMTSGGEAAIVYACRPRHGPPSRFGLRFSADGGMRRFDPPGDRRLASGLWGVKRATACDPGANPRVIRTLEDSPFYIRSLVETRLGGEDVAMMHERFDGNRFASPIVKAMLPVRMPRRAGSG
jgi:carotenoid 1,2-hydratase